MNNLIFRTVLFIFLGSSALASNPERLVCESVDAATIVVIEDLKVQGDGESNTAAASMLLVKVSGEISGDRIPLLGKQENSAKGKYYDLIGPDGYGFFISAPASKSSSELTVGGDEPINVNCF